jgi:hypothetical protein
MTGCHDDASGLADRSRSGEGGGVWPDYWPAVRWGTAWRLPTRERPSVRMRISRRYYKTEVSTVAVVYDHAIDLYGML